MTTFSFTSWIFLLLIYENFVKLFVKGPIPREIFENYKPSTPSRDTLTQRDVSSVHLNLDLSLALQSTVPRPSSATKSEAGTHIYDENKPLFSQSKIAIQGNTVFLPWKPTPGYRYFTSGGSRVENLVGTTSSDSVGRFLPVETSYRYDWSNNALNEKSPKSISWGRPLNQEITIEEKKIENYYQEIKEKLAKEEVKTLGIGTVMSDFFDIIQPQIFTICKEAEVLRFIRLTTECALLNIRCINEACEPTLFSEENLKEVQIKCFDRMKYLWGLVLIGETHIIENSNIKEEIYTTRRYIKEFPNNSHQRVRSVNWLLTQAWLKLDILPEREDITNWFNKNTELKISFKTSANRIVLNARFQKQIFSPTCTAL
ncbi:hypothetical protein O181_088271 [Austropuccinia psidii MF-1]|uniref:Uncharacterized protein n=1 Tax=Austropuccinia psidii MF-1 TaxID=1389203 RepID=A0A9Q3P6T0_9BASI|nr:hypothetical protein [Austropuccinia psidii MF-1]